MVASSQKLVVLCGVLAVWLAVAKAAFDDDFALDEKSQTSSGWITWESFLASISMIVVSELGDKTFFIAAILAMRNSRRVVLAGAAAALGVMTVLSALLGFALPAFLPKIYTHYASIALFLFFGGKLLYESYTMDPNHMAEEIEEVEQELAGLNNSSVDDMETGIPDYRSDRMTGAKRRGSVSLLSFLYAGSLPPVFYQTFSMTFLAEWGDRSQIATIALASHGDPIGVTIGGFLGHLFCTGIAVYGGKLLASRISEKTVALCGGVLFLLFAVQSILSGP